MDGRKKSKPEDIVEWMKVMMKNTMTWGEQADRMTSLKLNLSTGLMDGLSLSKRFMMSLKKGMPVKGRYLQSSDIDQSSKRLTLSGIQLKTWNRVGKKAQGRRQNYRREQKAILPVWKWLRIFKNGKNIGKIYKNEDPGPSRSSSNPIHFLDCSSKQPGKCTGELERSSVSKTFRSYFITHRR